MLPRTCSVFTADEAPDGLYIVLRGTVVVVKDTSIQSRLSETSPGPSASPTPSPADASQRTNIDDDIRRLSAAARNAAEGMGEVNGHVVASNGSCRELTVLAVVVPRQIVAVLGVGDCVGQGALIQHGAARSASVVTGGVADLCVVAASTARAFARRVVDVDGCLGATGSSCQLPTSTLCASAPGHYCTALAGAASCCRYTTHRLSHR